MIRPLLIIISGPPGVGKTTLAKEIGDKFHLPVISKDEIKELLFDSLGWSDRDWSKKLGHASYELLYYLIEKMLEQGGSFIVESNFMVELASKKFAVLLKKYNRQALQIICSAEQKQILSRFKKRWTTGKRHPGHMDNDHFILEKLLNEGNWQQPLKIKSQIIKLDLSDNNKVNFLKFHNLIEKAV